MDPLKRNNPGVRATNHENRIDALERRIIPSPLPYAKVLINTETVVAGANSSSANVGIPFHDDENPTFYQTGGFSLNEDGGILLPSAGLYDMIFTSTIQDLTWQTRNYFQVLYMTHGSQTLDSVLGSAMGTTTLESNIAWDGVGRTPTTDLRKPEMQTVWKERVLEDYGFGPESTTIWPTYYSITASQSTIWGAVFYIVRLSEEWDEE